MTKTQLRRLETLCAKVEALQCSINKDKDWTVYEGVAIAKDRLMLVYRDALRQLGPDEL